MKMNDMHDMGHKMNSGEMGVEPSEHKNKMSYPHLTLSSAEVPEVKKWKVGQKYNLNIVVEQKGIRESYNNKDEYEAEFDVIKVGVMGGKVDKEEYDKMDSDEKDKMDEKEVMGEDE